MKKHICILICYLNHGHIQKCYKSLQTGFTDFFIVENQSVNSDKIKNFFMNVKEKPIGYIQFKDNISNNAMKVFLKDYYSLIEQYEYITRSDCDLIVKDSKSTFNEIFKNLSFPNVMVSTVDLLMENLPKNIKGADRWIPNPTQITKDYIICNTGNHLTTVKNKDLDLYDPSRCLDRLLQKEVQKRNKLWVKTKVNKAYHLTWNLYYPGSPYLIYKRQNKGRLFNHNKYCEYIKYI